MIYAIFGASGILTDLTGPYGACSAGAAVPDSGIQAAPARVFLPGSFVRIKKKEMKRCSFRVEEEGSALLRWNL